jgi:serine/threonine protein kinase
MLRQTNARRHPGYARDRCLPYVSPQLRSLLTLLLTDRDLKPGNILVSKDCQLRITDFGLARFIDKVTLSGNNRQNPLTEYVVTRWYRCPELLLSPNLPYSAAIDIWSIGCIIGELIKRKPLFPGKSHANQVQLILEVRGYSNPTNLGFELTSEAASFLDRKCRYGGKALSSFIPQSSSDALELLETLLDLNPKHRPSAARALQFSYLQDAQLLCDYQRPQHMPRKIDEKYFDFERVEYSLGALQSMVREECEAPCDDSVFFPEEQQGQGQGSDGGEEGEESEGEEEEQYAATAQRMKLHHQRQQSHGDVHSSEHDEALQSHSYRQPHQQQQQQVTQMRSQASLKNTTPSRPLDRSDSSQTIPMGASGAEVVKMNRSKSAPPSPSPQKMEMITKQEKKHKRRFFLQGLHKSSHDQDQNSGTINSARSDHAAPAHAPPSSSHEELTSRRDIIAPAGVIRAGVHQLSAAAAHASNSAASSLRSVSSKYITTGAALSSAGAGVGGAAAGPGEYHSYSEKRTPQLSHQFQNLSVSYGQRGQSNQDAVSHGQQLLMPPRKLASAPPVETRITRLPAVHLKKGSYGSSR